MLVLLLIPCGVGGRGSNCPIAVTWGWRIQATIRRRCAARERGCDRGHRGDLGLTPPGSDLPPLRGLNQVPRRLVGAGSPEPPVLCDRSPRPSARHLQTHGRPNGSGLETLAERNKFATKAVRIRGRSRPTLQHAGVMRNHAEHGIGHWGVEPRALLLSFRALTSPAQSSATFKSRARGSSNPVKSGVR